MHSPSIIFVKLLLVLACVVVISQGATTEQIEQVKNIQSAGKLRGKDASTAEKIISSGETGANNEFDSSVQDFINMQEKKGTKKQAKHAHGHNHDHHDHHHDHDHDHDHDHHGHSHGHKHEHKGKGKKGKSGKKNKNKQRSEF